MKTIKLNKSAVGTAVTLVGGVLWGFSAACGQYLFDHNGVDSVWLTSVRMLFAGIILLGWSYMRHGSAVFSVFKEKKDIGALINFALTGLLLCQFSYLTAIQYSNAGTATVMQYLGLVLVMGWVCVKEHRAPSTREFSAVSLALVGTFLLATHGNPGELTISVQGLTWGLIAAVGMAAYTLVPTWILDKHGSAAIMGWGMLLGGSVLGLSTGAFFRMPALDMAGWLALAGVVIVGTVLAFTLYMEGVRLIGALRASVIASVEPVSAAVFAVMWLGSPFGLIDYLAFVMIISTVFLLTGKKSEPLPEGV